MAAIRATKSSSLSLVAYRGDAKTLLAFDLTDEQARNLAGFTIQITPPGVAPYYLYNTLRFEDPAAHAQVASESPNSSVNAPIHKFRWLHVPGSVHQGLRPAYGTYTYAVTPRYFDGKRSLQPIDQSMTTAVDIDVGPLDDAALLVGFTRGYVQSQAFANHFGLKALIRPPTDELLFDTSQVAGRNAQGEQFTYADEYAWSGFTAREMIFAVLDEVRAKPGFRLDVFAYDLDEPEVLKILLELAEQGRVRIVLDNAALHHSATEPTREDQFEALFKQRARKPAEIKRGKFGRYAHDKVLIVYDASGAPQKVLTGSTNFSVTGLYVNANHVLVFPDTAVASEYAKVFETAWDEDVSRGPYLTSPIASEVFAVPDPPPAATITFAPHTRDFATDLLNGVVSRIQREGSDPNAGGSVFFAVMGISGKNLVYDALNAVHENPAIFSMGVSDSPEGISLYAPGRRTGVLVTGKPNKVRLPPPFNQVPGIGRAHEIHHKFVVCGFGGGDPVVYCGSSNLAEGGEENNGDNLLEIHDPDVVTAFSIEALSLVDHFQFLDGLARREASGRPDKKPPPPAIKQQAAVSAQWFLSTTDRWTRPYFDENDLHFVDRQLFARPAHRIRQ